MRCGTFRFPAVGASARQTPVSSMTAACAGCPGRGAARWRCWPGERRVLHPVGTGQPRGCVRFSARGDRAGATPDEAERAHLFDLARAQGPARKRALRHPQQVRPEVQATLEAFTGRPAFVRKGRLDVMGTNLLGRAVYDEMFQDRIAPPNLARFAFLDERAHRFNPDWERAADETVAILRTEADMSAEAL